MEIRERIIDKAAGLFFKLGIRNVSMDDIAGSVGISKRTVYEVFNNKTELIETCLRHMIKERDRLFLETTASSANVIEEMITLMNCGVKIINAINPSFFHDIKKYYPEMWQTLYEENQKRNYSISFERLQRGIKEGLFRKNIDIEIVAVLFEAQMDMLSNETVFSPEEYKFADLFKNLIVNFVRGISTPKGIELVDLMLDELP